MQKKTMKVIIPIAIVLIIVLIIYSTFAGTYNKMVSMDEGVKGAWSQVENVYQRRFDLIPNLVETVKGYAAQEKDTFTEVAEARANAGGVMQMSDELLNDPAAFERFQQAQSGLGSALQRLLVVTENYPELKSNQNFMALQDQLEGTENRIAVERKRFNDQVQTYNTYIKQFPRMIIANMSGFDEKPYFEALQGAETAPKVEF